MTYSSTSFYARATDPFLSLSAVCLNTGEETEGWSSTSSVSPSYGGWVTPNDPSWTFTDALPITPEGSITPTLSRSQVFSSTIHPDTYHFDKTHSLSSSGSVSLSSHSSKKSSQKGATLSLEDLFSPLTDDCSSSNRPHQSYQCLEKAEMQCEDWHDPDLVVHAVNELIEMAPSHAMWVLSRALDTAITRLL